MTYALNQPIRIGEYNSFVGANGTSAYGAEPAGTTVATGANLGIMYGPGYGSWGYNQSAISLATVTTADQIKSSQWTNLRNILANIRTHQTGSVDVLIPSTSLFNVGHVVEAHVVAPPTSDPYDIPAMIDLAAGNRFAMAAPTLFSLQTMTRVGSWGAAGGNITGTLTCSWADADAAGWFFNTGGYIQFVFSQPITTVQDNDWNTAFAARIGSMRFGATGMTCTGTSGFTSAVGYYGLSGTYQTAWLTTSQTNGFINGHYNTNSIRVEARCTGTPAHGRLGEVVDFRFTLTDDHIGLGTDSVSAGTAVSMTAVKDTTNLTTPPATPGSAITINW